MKQRVLITAGASGIGSVIAKAFAKQGARVYICDINTQALQEMATEIPGLWTKTCDVSQPSEIEAMVAYGAEKLGGYDVLINNAGIAGPTAPVDQVDPEDWEKVMQTDLNSAFHVTRLVIPYLKKSEAGVIITMSSVAGRLGYGNRSPYATAKWGLIGFTKSLAIELGNYGIRANAILPGLVEGPRIQKVIEARAKMNGISVEEEMKNAMRVQSIKRLVDPADIAALAIFLASDHGKSISGQIIPIDNDMQSAS